MGSNHHVILAQIERNGRQKPQPVHLIKMRYKPPAKVNTCHIRISSQVSGKQLCKKFQQTKTVFSKSRLCFLCTSHQTMDTQTLITSDETVSLPAISLRGGSQGSRSSIFCPLTLEVTVGWVVITNFIRLTYFPV